ncbi:MAG TPA: hypothetical protein VMM76_11505, partial [Pirellulaceae bacterium]|nr:hypothetical protein [Pirellulaceae bacterium]
KSPERNVAVMPLRQMENPLGAIVGLSGVEDWGGCDMMSLVSYVGYGQVRSQSCDCSFQLVFRFSKSNRRNE